MNIEQIVEEFKTFKPCSCQNVKDRCSECPSEQKYEDWFREKLVTLQAEHEREMGELVQEILDEQSTYDNYNNTKCYQAVSVEAIKAIATRRALLKKK